MTNVVRVPGSTSLPSGEREFGGSQRSREFTDQGSPAANNGNIVFSPGGSATPAGAATYAAAPAYCDDHCPYCWGPESD